MPHPGGLPRLASVVGDVHGQLGHPGPGSTGLTLHLHRDDQTPSGGSRVVHAQRWREPDGRHRQLPVVVPADVPGTERPRRADLGAEVGEAPLGRHLQPVRRRAGWHCERAEAGVRRLTDQHTVAVEGGPGGVDDRTTGVPLGIAVQGNVHLDLVTDPGDALAGPTRGREGRTVGRATPTLPGVSAGPVRARLAHQRCLEIGPPFFDVAPERQLRGPAHISGAVVLDPLPGHHCGHSGRPTTQTRAELREDHPLALQTRIAALELLGDRGQLRAAVGLVEAGREPAGEGLAEHVQVGAVRNLQIRPLAADVADEPFAGDGPTELPGRQPGEVEREKAEAVAAAVRAEERRSDVHQRRLGRSIGDRHTHRPGLPVVDGQRGVALHDQLRLGELGGPVFEEEDAGEPVTALGQPGVGGAVRVVQVVGPEGVQVDQRGDVLGRGRSGGVQVAHRDLVALHLPVDSDRGDRDGLPGAGHDPPGPVAVGADPGVRGDSGAGAAARGHRDLGRRQGEQAGRCRLALRPGHLEGEVQGDRVRAVVTPVDSPGDRGVVVVRPGRLPEADADGVADHPLGDRPGHVDPAGTLLEGGLLRVRLRRRHQCRLELGRRPAAVLLGDQRDRAGDVRGGHRGAGDGDVGVAHRVAEQRSLAPGGDDVDAGSRQVRLQPAVAHPGASAGEVGQGVVPVHRAHRERGVSRAGRADRAVGAVVAGGDHEERAGLRGQRLDGRLQRVDVGRVRTAQTHVDHVGVLVDGGPLHAGQDRRVRAAEVLADLAVEKRGVRCDAPILAARGSATAGDDRGDVGAVANCVTGIGGLGEVVRLGDPARQVGVVGVDAGVQHRDAYPLTGEACLVRGRRADLRHAVVQRDVSAAVEPDSVGTPRRADPGVRAGERCPDRRDLLLVRRRGDPTDRGQLRGDGQPGGCGGPLSSARSACDEHGKVVPPGVVVTGGDQPGHIEQSPVDPTGPDQRHCVLRQHGDLTAVTGGDEAQMSPSRAGPDGSRPGRGDGDLVTGEQGDGLRGGDAGRGTRGGVGCGAGGWAGHGERWSAQDEGCYRGDGCGHSSASMQRILLGGASIPMTGFHRPESVLHTRYAEKGSKI